MGRKIGSLLTALKDKASLFERECKRLRVQLEEKTAECERLKAALREALDKEITE